MLNRPITLVLSLFEKVKTATPNHRTGAQRWYACCPCHEDTKPSMVVESRTDGNVLFHCHVGCDHRDIEAFVTTRLPEEQTRLY